MSASVIETPRLFIRSLTPEDATHIYEAQVESWDALSQWDIWAFKPISELTVEDTESFCRYKIGKQGDLTFACFNRESDKFIGIGGLNKKDPQQVSFFIGYWVRTSESGKGYATEIAQGLMDYAFNVLSAQKITSHHADGNAGSRRVLEKLGMIYERNAIADNLLHGQPVEECHYYKLKP